MNGQNSRMRRWQLNACIVIALALTVVLHQFATPVSPALAQANYVIHISVDGLGSFYLQPLLNAGRVPNFARLIREGASTLNARTDHDWTITLPNHTSQLTGRPVNDKYGNSTSGHRWNTNITPDQGATLHTCRGFYIASTFDVAHDSGLSTGLYASKEKFILFKNSYDATNSMPDVTGPDNGRNKVDVFVNDDLDATAMVNAFKTNMQTAPTRYTFVHFVNPDYAGHNFGWGSAAYNDAVVQVDQMIGEMLVFIGSVLQLKNNTTVVLTADHGGGGNDHQDSTNPKMYTVPFMLWGPHVPAGANLYALNGTNTIDPGTGRIDYSLTAPQPIRNGDAGNCALRLLDLPAIPGSSLDYLSNVCSWTEPLTPTPTQMTLPNKLFMPFIGH